MIALIAGLVPIASVELFLVVTSAVVHPTIGDLVLCSLLATTGHQIAKTITYFGGEAALENKKLKPRVDAIRHKIEKWDRYPKAILFLAATVGLPPMYLLGFIAHPLMEIRFLPFTVLTFVGRLGRYIVLAVIPLAF